MRRGAVVVVLVMCVIGVTAGRVDAGETTSGPLVAMDLATGDTVWRKAAPPGLMYSGVFAHAGGVFAASMNGWCEQPRLARFDSEDGDVSWRADGSALNPSGRSGVIVVRSATTVRGIDARSGRERWQRDMLRGATALGSLVFSPVPDGSLASPAEGGIRSGIAAWHRRDGTPAWEFVTADDVDEVKGGLAPVYSDRRVSVTRNTLFREAPGAVVPFTSTTVVRVLDSANGEERFRLEVREEGGRPVVVGDALIIQDGPTLRAYDVSSGELRWEVEVGQTLYVDGSAKNGSVYVASGDRPGVVALDVRNGSAQWESDAPVNGLAVTESGRLAGVNRESIFSIDPRNGSTRWSRSYPTGIGPDSGVDLAIDRRAVYLTTTCDV